MKILEVAALDGPNYWSNYRQKIIVMTIDLGEFEELPTNRIEGFYERMSAQMPSLYAHRCSEESEGGFFSRVKLGTWMGHVIEHIALELQTLAGMECGYGRTRGTGRRGEYYVIFSYELERAGVYAARAAVEVAAAFASGTPAGIEAHVDELRRIRLSDDFGPSTKAILAEAKKRNIPFRRLDEHSSLVVLGQGVNQRKIRATMTGHTSNLGVETACDKEETKRVLSRAFIPVPEGEQIADAQDLERVIGRIGFPVVVKPVSGNHGRGITTNIHSMEDARSAFALAQGVSRNVIVEKFLEGFDFRFLVINYKLVAVARRTPAMVIGDGVSTIGQLIEEVNGDPRRGDGHENVLTRITVDKITKDILVRNGLDTGSVLPMGTPLVLKDTANLSTGGTAEDVTEQVHPDNVQMAERIARLLDLDICGIDVMVKDVSRPLREQNGGVLEVNACPGFRMHTHPSSGLGRNVGEAVIDMLFPEGRQARIPLVAITGTNGKTTTTRLIAHIARQSGFVAGYTTTEGIYINGTCIYEGDCTGPVSARAVLHDPTVSFAVLECARGGILRAGLGFDQCDVSVITNVSEDHLGLKGIDTIHQMARVKAVVAGSTKQGGHAVLNADDDLVYDMREEVDGDVVLFSTRINNPRIRRHSEKGGSSVVIDKGFLTICKGPWKMRVDRISDIPLSMEGRATAMIKNVLAATAAAVACNFSIENIRGALRTFVPSPEHTPGRMNVFRFDNFDFMIDYAHNSGGFEELRRFLGTFRNLHKVGIVAAVGDRRDDDIRAVGRYAAQIFDEIIIRHDEDLRGRSSEEITRLIMEGIKMTAPEKSALVISDELDAIRHAMAHARKGSFITVCTDKVKRSIEFVAQAMESEASLKKNYVLSKAS